MTETAGMRQFVLDALADAGATVSEGDALLWVQVPETVRSGLEIPARFAMTFDPERVREFDAELVAPGSYLLEKILFLATSRGRWDSERFETSDADWVGKALSASGLTSEAGVRFEVEAIDERALLLFSFRVSLVSDEKREQFHVIAVSPTADSAWEWDAGGTDAGLSPGSALIPQDVEAAYRLATHALQERTRETVHRFRAMSLHLLEEEVRRIFGYFDRTMEEMREADPDASTDLLRAIQAERDRRLTETLERFDPKAKASLCSIRAVFVPTARARLGFAGDRWVVVTVDAWSRHVTGLVCQACGGKDGPWITQESGVRCRRCGPTRAESAPPRGGLRSDTPRPRRQASRGRARLTPGPTVRPPSASGRRRAP